MSNMVRDLAVALARQRCVSITAHDSTSQVLETLSTLDSEVIELTLDVRGRNAGIREVPAQNVVLDLPVVCATTDARRCDQWFPIDAPAVVEYLPSIDESWYAAKDCTVQADKQRQTISSSACADPSTGARYRVNWDDGDPNGKVVGIGSLRLRQLQPRTLADVVCCPSLCVLTASSHRFNSAAVLEARLADGERIGADTLRLLHSRFDAARGMPPVLRRALIQIHESRGAAQREQTNDLAALVARRAAAHTAVESGRGSVDRVFDSECDYRALAATQVSVCEGVEKGRSRRGWRLWPSR